MVVLNFRSKFLAATENKVFFFQPRGARDAKQPRTEGISNRLVFSFSGYASLLNTPGPVGAHKARIKPLVAHLVSPELAMMPNTALYAAKKRKKPVQKM